MRTQYNIVSGPPRETRIQKSPGHDFLIFLGQFGAAVFSWDYRNLIFWWNWKRYFDMSWGHGKDHSIFKPCLDNSVLIWIVEFSISSWPAKREIAQYLTMKWIAENLVIFCLIALVFNSNLAASGECDTPDLLTKCDACVAKSETCVWCIDDDGK